MANLKSKTKLQLEAIGRESDLRGLLTDATGNILIFESKLKARSMGHKKDGRAVPFGDKWAIKKY
jgi:hypothetical protein